MDTPLLILAILSTWLSFGLGWVAARRRYNVKPFFAFNNRTVFINVPATPDHWLRFTVRTRASNLDDDEWNIYAEGMTEAYNRSLTVAQS